MEISTLSSTLSFPSLQKPTFLSSSNSLFLNHGTNSLFRSINKKGLGLRVQTRPTNRARKGFICNSLFGLGIPELAVIAGVAALVFGPKQLPEIGKNFGKTIKSFQQAAKEFEQELKKPEDESSENVLEATSSSESSEEKENVVSSSKESS
ncbi:Sec-independent protein translocase protein TATA chloroplastic [Bienertia sinuspersici]